MIRTIILFIIIFSIVVISHELGHFLIGRKNGIRVLEFSVGMGPTLFSFIKGGVKYSLKLLPIGGACMFDGEDGTAGDEEEPGGLRRRAGVEADLPLPSERERSGFGRNDLESPGVAFPEAGVWRRIAAVFAGPCFNFILAFVVAVVLTAFSGADLPVIGQLKIPQPERQACRRETGLYRSTVRRSISIERW